MKRSMVILLWVMGMNLAKAQMQSPDTSARYFLIHASIGNLQEIASGQVAMKKGTTPQIRAFGKMMVDDHNKAEAQLLQLVKTQGIALPLAATQMPVPDLNFEKAQGAVFDRLYAHSMEPTHRQTLNMFRDYALTGKNPLVRDFAKQTSPIIKKHLDEIVAINQQLVIK